MKKIIKILEEYVSNNNIQREYALDKFLDFLLDFFDYKHYLPNMLEWNNYIKKTASCEPLLFKATMEWMNLTSSMIEECGVYDTLGRLYEQMYQSSHKAGMLGQFFTPEPLCEAMAMSLIKNNSDKLISDSACGSGRTLIAAYKYNNKGYFIGEDIDGMSVKMCALNMMIHGMRGRAVCHDALKDSMHFGWGYEINEIRFPFPSIYYSVRRITNPAPEQETEKKAQTEKTAKSLKQLELF